MSLNLDNRDPKGLKKIWVLFSVFHLDFISSDFVVGNT